MIERAQNRDSIVILTKDQPEHIIAANGSGSWKINVGQWSEKVRWLILTNKVDGVRKITLVGRVSGFELDKGGSNPDRYAIKIRSYATVEDLGLIFDGASSKSSNPVQFKNAMDVLKFNLEDLELTPVPKQTLRQSYERPGEIARQIQSKPLTIVEAKEGLALSFGVEPEQVEITIRA